MSQREWNDGRKKSLRPDPKIPNPMKKSIVVTPDSFQGHPALNSSDAETSSA
jgi:hypothetical protein